MDKARTNSVFFKTDNFSLFVAELVAPFEETTFEAAEIDVWPEEVDFRIVEIFRMLEIDQNKIATSAIATGVSKKKLNVKKESKLDAPLSPESEYMIAPIFSSNFPKIKKIPNK